jgi:hypothetical protein
MDEIAPGILHWTAIHPSHGMRVSCYLHRPTRTAIDPLLPAEGIAALDTEDRRPRAIVLTNRHHRRSAPELAEAFGAPIHVSRAGLHEYADRTDVGPFDPGDVLEGGLEVCEVGAICPDEVALYLPDVEALACADGVVRWEPDDPLGFVPDSLLGDAPDEVRAGLRAAYGRLAELPFRHLLLAHGNPVVGDGRAALAAFAAGP